ncbi:hypothetical protein [Acidiferrobacter thiooxydans]|uniref:hypothetical protein n=1 Tax=Acidiferrobacter thiooxydans TaxID=163359 RepID=UPI000825B57C|nr:hypothetical protein [Acidiferrobacter thiooxydans]MDA8118782.1 hypothetical protein [Gammaproteobacteria bacterium]MDA8191484.1 hypothetical protein [Gammaproteobacteria bacterium]UEN99324.1 hypothetical protein A9R16_012970 [Acidiferrobacter thiooxydans]
MNPKRRFRAIREADRGVWEGLAQRARYGGNPDHKKNPGDFGLTPPSGARLGKSLCDDADIVSRAEALEYLQKGLRRGFVSERLCGEWPQNVWAVSDAGVPLEAQLENRETGTCHGYPLCGSDPLAKEILSRWEAL